jgi:hypothetical protein
VSLSCSGERGNIAMPKEYLPHHEKDKIRK